MAAARAQPPSVVITGASSGIGYHCSRRMAKRGWRVYACVRRRSDLASLESVEGERPVGVLLDVTDPHGVTALCSRLDAELGAHGLHGLVNNAGVVAAGPFEVVPIESWRETVEVNLLGAVTVTRALLPLLRLAQGRIVNMSSIAGRVASPYLAPYCASKFALEGLSDALRRELAGDGIRVSVVEPGVVDTRIWDKGLAGLRALQESLDGAMAARYADVIDSLTARLASTRQGGIGPARVAAAVEHALTADRSRARYPVGPGVRLKILLDRLFSITLSDGPARRR